MKKCIKWTIAIVGILSLLRVIFVIYTSDASIESLNDTNSIKVSSAKKVVYYYSPGRPDRSGAIVHDMLFAHAYIYDTNHQQNEIHGIYSGCCGSNIVSLNDTYQLLVDLRWDSILRFDCPPPISSQNRTNTTGTTTTDIFDDDIYVLLNPKTYRQYDVRIFKQEWRDYFIQQIHIYTQQHQQADNANSTNSTLDSSTNELHEYNNRYNASDAVAPYRNTNDIVDDVVPMQYSIAVHIRRGDVDPCQYKERYLPNSHYLQLIQQYISILLSSSSTTTNTTQTPPMGLSRENIAVTIYSESISHEPLNIFEQYNYTVSVDDALSTVWSALSTAHVAILSKSSFSYVPAIMNPNRVVYTPFRHQPMSQWDVVSDTIVSQSMSEVMTLHNTTCNISSLTK